LSKLLVDEINPKTSGANVVTTINCLAQVQLTTSNTQDTSNPYTVADTAIKFDKVVINRGSCYSASTGKFTAPTDGIYEFNYSLLTDDSTSSDHHIRVYKNDARIQASEAYAGVNTQHIQLTGQLYIELEANDNLHLELNSGGRLFIGSEGRYSSVNFRLVGV